MTRVTVVVNDLPGGSETFLGSFARVLSELGHDVTLLALRATGRPSVDLGPGVVVAHALPPLASWRAPAAVAGLARHHGASVVAAATRARAGSARGTAAVRAAALAAPILATEPDVVHFSFGGIAVACEPTFDLLGGVTLVASCRGSSEQVRPLLDPDRRRALGRVLPRLDAVHAVSSSMAATVVGYGARPGSVRVIRPAVDLDRFPARAAPPEHSGPLHLVTVGRLEPLKGHDDLISALGLLRARGVDAELTVIGGGGHRQALAARTHLLGLADHVHLRGACSPSEVARALAEADVFVSASLSEGISNAVLEAGAIGVPVVATDVGGTREIIEDGREGIVVPPADPGRMAEALATLAHDADLRAGLGRAGHERVVADFGMERMRGEWAELYDDLMADPRGLRATGGDLP